MKKYLFIICILFNCHLSARDYYTSVYLKKNVELLKKSCGKGVFNFFDDYEKINDLTLKNKIKPYLKGDMEIGAININLDGNNIYMNVLDPKKWDEICYFETNKVVNLKYYILYKNNRSYYFIDVVDF